MDVESLSNHIRHLGKIEFDYVCRLVITNCFNKFPINVDGTNDGGTDFSDIDAYGKRSKVAYQLTVQKVKFEEKFVKDAKKAIDKLGVKRFYYMTSNPMSETVARTLESQLTDELDITCICLGCKAIAELLISHGCANKALSNISISIPRDINLDDLDYRERTLHSYTLLSNDARNLREGIYDDTIMMILGTKSNAYDRLSIVEEVKKMLSLTESRDEMLLGRVDSLLSKHKLECNKETGVLSLTAETQQEIDSRRNLYNADLSAMVSAQTDIMHDNGIEWTLDDSRKTSIWLAQRFISLQISTLNEAKSQLVLHPILGLDKKDDSITKLVSYLQQKGASKELSKKLADDLQSLASNDPLIQKITRASMYIALEGNNPMSRSKALGSNSWDEFTMLVDTSVALPYICYTLFNKYDYGIAKDSIRALNRAKELGIQPKITYFYVKECAGHLLSALDYIGLDFPDYEMQYSSNAFVAHYYGMKVKGIRVPTTLLDFLATFSALVKSKYEDRKNQVRAVMTDIQGLLNSVNVEFEGVPKYETEDCSVYRSYRDVVEKKDPSKSRYLIDHDTWALQHLFDCTNKNGEHWLFLTYDSTLREYGRQDKSTIWITKPSKFLEFVECTQDLSESNLEEMVHLIAASSESTLSIGARMIDKVLEYASQDMQNYEFQSAFKQFKQESLEANDYHEVRSRDEIDKIADRLVEEFLNKKGIEIKTIEPEDDEVDFSQASSVK